MPLYGVKGAPILPFERAVDPVLFRVLVASLPRRGARYNLLSEPVEPWHKGEYHTARKLHVQSQTTSRTLYFVSCSKVYARRDWKSWINISRTSEERAGSPISYYLIDGESGSLCQPDRTLYCADFLRHYFGQ